MADEPQVTVPTLVSLLICDQVIDDKFTNKKSAIGLFNTVLLQTTPAAVNHLVVLATLTEITHRTPTQLRLVRDSDNAELFSAKGFVDAPTPLSTVDLVFAMQGLQIPSVGQYAFELWCGSELLGRRRFQAVLHQPPRPPDKAPPEDDSEGDDKE